MESKKVNYSKGLIYKICCLDTSIKEVYIGSTTNFDQRKKQHKANCNSSKSKKYNLNVYKFIRENGGWNNFDMVLIEYYPCETKLELEREERKILEQQDLTLNSCVPTRSKREWSENNSEKMIEYMKKYRETNKEKIKEQRKEYYETNKEKKKEYYENNKEKKKEYYKNNKEKINERKKEYGAKKIKCMCGVEVRRDNITQHRRTKKHIELMANKNLE